MQNIDLQTLYDGCSIKDVLDIGSNAGSFNYANLPNWKVTCIDQLDIQHEFPPNCTFSRINFSEFNTNDRFDFIICKYVLEHQEDTDSGNMMIQKISSLLRPGGYALFVLPIGCSLSNTIYKSLFNMKLHEGMGSTRDGGHWANYDEKIIEQQFRGSGLDVVYKLIEHDDMAKWVYPSGYPYDTFRSCVEYYLANGIDLTASTMVYYVKKGAV